MPKLNGVYVPGTVEYHTANRKGWHPLLRLLWWALRQPSVVIIDFQGEKKVRRVYYDGYTLVAHAVPYNIHTVRLLKGGSVRKAMKLGASDGSYFKSWEPAPWCVGWRGWPVIVNMDVP